MLGFWRLDFWVLSQEVEYRSKMALSQKLLETQNAGIFATKPNLLGIYAESLKFWYYRLFLIDRKIIYA